MSEYKVGQEISSESIVEKMTNELRLYYDMVSIEFGSNQGDMDRQKPIISPKDSSCTTDALQVMLLSSICVVALRVGFPSGICIDTYFEGSSFMSGRFRKFDIEIQPHESCWYHYVNSLPLQFLFYTRWWSYNEHATSHLSA